jgi:hypothetical protein
MISKRNRRPLTSRNLAVFLTLTTNLILHQLQNAAAQTFNEILKSDPYRKVVTDSVQHLSDAEQRKEIGNPVTNYDLLWADKKPGVLLLDWVGATSAGFSLEKSTGGNRDEFAYAYTTLTSQERVRVEISIQVPQPKYLTMAEYGTLKSFNRFRPPLLDVVADQIVPIQGIDAKYYRHTSGACSLLFNLQKQSIVNLYVAKCSDSAVMMSAAKALNFARLNQKLSS